MRLSLFFLPTLRETPADAEIVSHKLMLRAGMIKRVAAGIYSYLPMGLRTIKKVENIVRNCMNEAGAVELLMPSVQPAELWEESGRWQQYGKELLRFKDRHNRDFCLGPTHEEVITEIVRDSIKSYKQLPINMYQIQTKFRDEVRPRFGLMRGREFIMKDAYSFDCDDEGAQISYDKMRNAYCKIFERCGLSYKMVEADSGAIGGSYSHEFMVIANTGEDAVISCNSCSYAANMEKAVAVKPKSVFIREEGTLEDEYTPGTDTVEQAVNYMRVPYEVIIKTLIVKADGKFIAILIRGDHEANLIKVKNYLDVSEVEMADPDEIFKLTGAPIGYLGPIGLNMPIYADNAIEDIVYGYTGRNKKDYHYKGVKPGRDFTPVSYADFRNAQVGDKCPCCSDGVYELTRGIEVGHIFKLGTKYSEAMGAKYLDSNGKQQTMVMGCYGIGIGRIAAAAIEQNHDEKGICWPLAIAPFELAIIPLNSNEPKVVNLAESLYKQCLKLSIDVCIDDRPDRAGSKLADADLAGYPLRINVGKKHIEDGNVEVVNRLNNTVTIVDKEHVIAHITDIIKGNI